MIYATIKKIIIFCSILVFLISLGHPLSAMSEEKRFDVHKVKGEWRLPKHYPKYGFDGYGCVQVITDSYIVIDDVRMDFAMRMTYNTPSSADSHSLDFRKGTLVAFNKDEDNKVKSLWLIKEKCE